MGCTSAQVEEQAIKVVPLEYRIVNSYIDKLSLFVLQKLKEKFDSYSNESAELPLDQFQNMYSPFLRSHPPFKPGSAETGEPAFIAHLYLYYNDLKPKGLKSRNFITKYATLHFCDENTFAAIIYFILGAEEALRGELSGEIYNKFIVQNRQYFGFEPEKTNESTISTEAFKQKLKESGFLYQDYRKVFSLIDKDDMPFEAINRGLLEMDMSDFQVGQEYYVLSSAWFERWSYYFQGLQDEQESNIKSTKLLKRRETLYSARNKGGGPGLVHKKSMRDMSNINDSATVIERPNQISYDEIEGEFMGELKEYLRVHYECKIVSKQLWELFKKTMPAEIEFPRKAVSLSSLDMYPKNVYFLKTDPEGEILDKTLKIISLSLKSILSQIQNPDQSEGAETKRSYYFIKNLGDNIWSEEDPSTLLARCSTELRFFVVKTETKVGFIEKYFRKKKDIKNITYGDKVFSYFAFNKKVIPAFVMSLPTPETAKIHYCDYNFRYEIEVPRDSLSLEQDTLMESLKNPLNSTRNITDNFSFKGIKNIGNTCFINSIIQCLIATPVMGAYLSQSKFNKDKQPLLYQISKLAVDLLANKAVSPVELKKVIDVNMEMFSGHNQHDAQQFLSLLLDRFLEQILPYKPKQNGSSKKGEEEEVIVDHLFGGVVQSKITCSGCGYEKLIDQKASIVSLPVPEPEYNTYSLYVFPIYDRKIKRVVLRIHRNSTLTDYVRAFEGRLGVSAMDYIFLQVESGSVKRTRSDFYEPETVKGTNMSNGFTPNIDIHCFEKIADRDLRFVRDENYRAHSSQKRKYFDYRDEEGQWNYARLVELKESKVLMEVMEEDGSISLIKLKGYPESQIKPLGSMVKQKVFKKLFNRRFNSILNKMEPFGFHYMISFPKEVNYRQLEEIVRVVMSNFIQGGSRSSPYHVKIKETNKGICMFCGKVEKGNQKSLKQSTKSSTKCCSPTEEDIDTPLVWIAREKSYSIYIDWFNLDDYSTDFTSSAQLDAMSAAAEKAQNSDKINLQQCLKLLQQPEQVEIECDKCKYKEAKRLQTLKIVPNILILHMKQFRFTASHTLIKIDANIHWVEFLDISKYSINPSGNLYELFAYVRHTGSSESGHYTCVAKRKHPFENKRVWVNFDDEQTTMLDKEEKNIDSAYLLFFKKVDMPNSSYVNFNGLREMEPLGKSKELVSR